MPRKKSIKASADKFQRRADELLEFLDAAERHLPVQQHISWVYEYGVLRLYREFESMILEALVGVINSDTTTISSRTGVVFPKHLTDEVCEYLIIGDGYFDFKGRDGLIKTLKEYVPNNHYLVGIIKKDTYKNALEYLSSLRNLAAHNSKIAKTRAKRAVDQERMPEAGVWLKKQERLKKMVVSLRKLSGEIEAAAPY